MTSFCIEECIQLCIFFNLTISTFILFSSLPRCWIYSWESVPCSKSEHTCIVLRCELTLTIPPDPLFTPQSNPVMSAFGFKRRDVCRIEIGEVTSFFFDANISGVEPSYIFEVDFVAASSKLKMIVWATWIYSIQTSFANTHNNRLLRTKIYFLRSLVFWCVAVSTKALPK